MVTIPKSLILNCLDKKNPKTKQTPLFPIRRCSFDFQTTYRSEDLEHFVNLYAKLIKMNVIVMMVLFYAAPDLRGSCAFWGCSAYRGNGMMENISVFVITPSLKRKFTLKPVTSL